MYAPGTRITDRGNHKGLFAGEMPALSGGVYSFETGYLR